MFGLSLGGVLGGIFNAIVAPMLFRSVIEYPLAILLSCLLLPGLKARANGLKERRLDFALTDSDLRIHGRTWMDGRQVCAD